MSQLPERYRTAVAPLIDKARELLKQGEELAPMAFVGNFTTGATIPTALVMRSPADKDAAARAVKLLAEQLDADFVFVLMGVLSRNRRKFRQPINVACPAPGRWGRPNSRVTSRHFDHGNASRTSRPDCSGLDEAD